MMELAANLALGLDPLRPVHDRPVAGAAEVRCDLLGPLVGRVHGVRPTHRIMVVRLHPTELVEMSLQELRRLEVAEPRDRHHLVIGALKRALGRSAVVTDDHIDQRVIQDLEVLDRVDQPPDVMVGVLEEACVDLHLAGEYWFHLGRDGLPGRNLRMALRQLTILRDHAELLLPREGLLAQLVPALIELALVLVEPLRRHMMRGVRRARRKIGEERLVRHERLLLADPLDCLGGQVVGEVIALLGRLLRLDG